jgi:hypothetical protein
MQTSESGTPEYRIRQAILSAQNYAADEVSVDSVLEGLANGQYQGWHFDGLYLVTTLIQYETHSRVRICYAAGALTDELIQFALSKIEEFAHAVGAIGVELYGRKGWVKRLKPYGYDEQYAVVLKRL